MPYLALSIFLSLGVDLAVFVNSYSPKVYALWLISLITLTPYVITPIKLIPQKLRLSAKNYIVIFVLLLPLFVRIANYTIDRVHGDDLISAYLSATEDFAHINLFSGIPQEASQWISKFPTTYFILQKLFFSLTGADLFTVKLSVLPYVLVISITLYLIVSDMLDKKSAVIAVVLYSFYSPALYLETLGLHFVSSTAVFMIFFYVLLKYFKNSTNGSALALGVLAGLNCLFYLTSYIAYPLLMALFFVGFLKIKGRKMLLHLLLATIGFAIVTGPYLVYAIRYENYFFSRINQVSFFTGYWSNLPSKIQDGQTLGRISGNMLITAIRSLYQDNLGGHGGYNFGFMAFFNRTSLILFCAGVLAAVYLSFKKRRLLLVLAVVILSFFTMILSIPPPAYHRMSLAFPFITIIFTVPFYLFMHFPRVPTLLKFFCVLAVLTVFVVQNERYFLKSVESELHNQNLQLARYINQNFPYRHIKVASFPGYNFDKYYYFSPNKRFMSITTDYHANLIKSFSAHEKYLYVIIFPEVFSQKFAELDPRGKLIPFTDSYSIFVN